MRTISREMRKLDRYLAAKRKNFLLILFLMMATSGFLLYKYPKNISSDIQAKFSTGDPSHDAQSSLETYDKWIVMTATKPIQKTLLIFARRYGYQLLVVGDSKGAEDNPKEFSNLMWLTRENQASLGYKIAELIPADSPMRKNIGYLYAIEHGARQIYDLEESVTPLREIPSVATENSTGLLVESSGLFNSYAHYGQPKLIPRGIPDASAKQPNYTIGLQSPTAIYQGLISGIPDLDFVKLSKTNFDEVLGTSFDQTSPPVVTSKGTFAPYNSINTLVQYEALWSLLLPLTQTIQSDIWRSYIAQKLLWSLELKLAFCPVNAVRNYTVVHLNISDEDSDIGSGINQLLSHLKTWTCVSTHLESCFKDLYNDLRMKDLVEDIDLRLSSAWIQDLKNVGYTFPRIPETKAMLPEARQTLDYFPNEGASSEKKILKDSVAYLRELCPNRRMPDERREKQPDFADVLLIVAYNHPETKNLKIIKSLYSYHFANIVVCGYKTSGVEDAKEAQMSYVASDVYQLINTSNVVDCIRNVLLMNHNVKGYMVIQDDIILNSWNLVSYNRSKIWSTFDWRYFDSFGDAQAMKNVKPDGGLSQRDIDGWVYPQDNIPKLQKALKSLQNSGIGSSSKKCHDSLKTRLKGPMRFDYGQCDVFYLPKRLADAFAEVIQNFIDYDVFFEISCPTTLRCLEEPSFHQELEFSHFNVNANPPKGLLWKFYKDMVNRPYIHPYKFSKVIAGDKNRLEAFCDDLVPVFIQNMPSPTS